jgi:hypothetical protein
VKSTTACLSTPLSCCTAIGLIMAIVGAFSNNLNHNGIVHFREVEKLEKEYRL